MSCCDRPVKKALVFLAPQQSTGHPVTLGSNKCRPEAMNSSRNSYGVNQAAI